jgi:hypothetical protein
MMVQASRQSKGRVKTGCRGIRQLSCLKYRHT